MFTLPLPQVKVCFIAVLLLAFAYCQAAAQTPSQTIRGIVTDNISQTSLIGVSIRVENNPALGTVTDELGNYRLSNVPLGRQTLIISYIGYETQVIPNVMVTAGKEVILNITLQESISQLDEITVTADTDEDKTTTRNDLAMVSSRSFNVDDTKRYAGSIGDPARMAANFAGVVGGNDARNDIVVRGNSPLGMLWQVEGLNMPNPNHFGSLMSTGGPISMINNNNLDKSDFITSAFPAQYGNATAGVFDINMRKGNNEKTEFMGQIGFNGFEIGAEGPFSKKTKASYMVNYRYSTMGIFNLLGINFGTGSSVPLYQDLNFKFSFPTKNNGSFSVFGLGGASKIDLIGSEADLDDDHNLYGNENADTYPRYFSGITGIAYEQPLTSKTFIKIVAGISRGKESFTSDSVARNEQHEVTGKYRWREADFRVTKYSAAMLTRTKFSSKSSLTSGVNIDMSDFTLYQHDIAPNVGRDTVRLNVNDQTALYRFHSTWKQRFSPNWLFQLGAHAQYYNLNKQWAAEPRTSLQYIANGGRHSFSLGYGLHNQIQHITTSFMQTHVNNETYLTNKDLKFSTSHHTVFTYDWNIAENLRLKAETYYQALSNIPVEQHPSSYSVVNMGAGYAPGTQDSLVNKGTGRNYGVELTLERFFNQGYYFLVTGSLFNSKYTGSDGIERNTGYNTNYVLNVLGGKEWKLKTGDFLSVNLKFTTIGGPYLTPLDFEQSQAVGYAVYREHEAFSERQRAYLRADLRVSFRKEYKRSTLEASLDFQNLTNQKNIFSESYNPRTNSVVTVYQQPFFPVPYVRFTF